ncbi:MAG: ABC-F family ATP-binding cassette domain-containing protein, partial [Acidimicrobiia bacterium]
AGEKVGLVGRNGTGKSTLLSVITGNPAKQIRSKGSVQHLGTVGHLPQVPPPGGLGVDSVVLSHILSGRGLDVLDEQLTAARKAMEADPTEDTIHQFVELEQRYGEADGYKAESIIARMADGIGLRQELLFADIDSLSGGQRRRADIIRLLFEAPDVMILDEPTNHLDMAAKRWLMGELASTDSTILVVSHDLELLDNSISKVLYLHDARLTEFKGNYSSFRTQLGEDIMRREKAAAQEEKEIKRLSTLADSMRGQTEKRAKTAKALDRRVEHMQQRRTEVHRKEKAVSFALPDPDRSGATPITVETLAVAYGPKDVLRRVDFAAHRGDRIAVVGRNGAGKSSLLRCLAGVQAPTQGTVELGANVVLGYFAQEHEQIDLDAPAIDNVDDSVLKLDAQRRSLLGSFGLSGAAMNQRAGSLSGGERAKLGLAMLAAGRCNLLILDEPTNNLDPASVEAVGRMFRAWKGTIVVVSHDPAFVAALEPTHCLRLPEERYDVWYDEDIDVVAMR